MNTRAVPCVSRFFGVMETDRGPILAGALSVLIHGVLLLALVLGVSWRNTPNQPVQAEIWTRLPEPAVMARPEPVVEAQPQAPPKVEPLPVHTPDIVLKASAKSQPKPKSKSQPSSKPPVASAEVKKREQQKREEARRRLEAELLSEEKVAMAAELAQVQSMRQQAERRARTATQLKDMAVRDAQDRIRLKIRGLLRIPEGLKGNPEVVYLVRLFPNGEIMGQPERLQSSGQPVYDAAVEAAILKASPLPLPTGMGAAADFRGGLELRFRPREE